MITKNYIQHHLIYFPKYGYALPGVVLLHKSLI